MSHTQVRIGVIVDKSCGQLQEPGLPETIDVQQEFARGVYAVCVCVCGRGVTQRAGGEGAGQALYEVLASRIRSSSSSSQVNQMSAGQIARGESLGRFYNGSRFGGSRVTAHRQLMIQQEASPDNDDAWMKGGNDGRRRR